MKTLLTTLALALLLTPTVQAQKKPEGVTYDVTITRVIDGDTVGFEARWLPAPLKPELSVRVYGVDTPEKGHRAKCPLENKRALAASEFTRQAIAKSKRHQLVLLDWDKYGSRVLGTILLDGKDLREMLIQNGHAIPYFGEAKTYDWCK